MVMSSDENITLKDLPDYVISEKEQAIDLDRIIPLNLALAEALDQIEERLISRALERSNNVQSRAAEMLGITRHAMHYKMKKYGMLSWLLKYFNKIYICNSSMLQV